jgi:hypothetical protein
LESCAKDNVTVKAISREEAEISLKIKTADREMRSNAGVEESVGSYGRRMWRTKVRMSERGRWRVGRGQMDDSNHRRVGYDIK